MRRIGLATAAVLLTAPMALALQAGAPEASAAGDCEMVPKQETLVTGETITTYVEVCTEDPANPTAGGGDGAGGGGGEQTCQFQGTPVPCQQGDKFWFASKSCYASAMTDPAPAPDSPVWGSHKPSDGAIWVCAGFPVYDPANQVGLMFFVPNGGAPAPVLIDGAAVAARALGQMTLVTPSIHMAPAPPDMTYVGLDTWLWIDEGQWRTLSQTVGAGGASVTVTVEPVRAWWGMGDGGTTTCPSAGRRWVNGMTSAERTDCSYAFTRVSDFESNGAFSVEASLVYRVDWTCTGPCQAASGSLGEVDGPASNAAIRVGERQAVVTGGNR